MMCIGSGLCFYWSTGFRETIPDQKHVLQQSLRSNLPTDQCGGKHGAVISKSANLYNHTSCSSRNIKKQDKHIKNTTHQNNTHHLNNNKGLHFCFPGGSMGSKATGALLGCPNVTPWWRESNVGGFMGRGMDI